MKSKYLILLSIMFSQPVFAATTFSPYVDLTLNVHWDNQYNDLVPASLTAIAAESHIKHFHLAFITDAGACEPAWGGQGAYSLAHAWGQHETDSMRLAGLQNTVSFGGASGNDISKSCSVSQMDKVWENVIKLYQPEGLDFDIENGTANVTNLMQSLQHFQALHPNVKVSFTLPVMPEGLTNEGVSVLQEARARGLKYHVNIMAMDYGPSYTNDMGVYAAMAATALYEQLRQLYPAESDSLLWSMVEVTPMIGVNDVNVEQFTLQDVQLLREFADKNHLGGLSMWSLNRDFACATPYASVTCSGNNLQSRAYQYSASFLN